MDSEQHRPQKTSFAYVKQRSCGPWWKFVFMTEPSHVWLVGLFVKPNAPATHQLSDKNVSAARLLIRPNTQVQFVLLMRQIEYNYSPNWWRLNHSDERSNLSQRQSERLTLLYIRFVIFLQMLPFPVSFNRICNHLFQDKKCVFLFRGSRTYSQ